MHGFVRLLDGAPSCRRIVTQPPSPIGEHRDALMRLHFDHEHTVVRDDHDEIRFAFDLPDVSRYAERMKDGPILGCRVRGECCEEIPLARRGALSAVVGNHSSHRPPPSGKGSRASWRGTTLVCGEIASTRVAMMSANPAPSTFT